MNKEEIINEFNRWIEAGRPAVWVKDKDKYPNNEWNKQFKTCWSQPDTKYYIVDDKQAELRKLVIDKPDTKIQVKYYTESSEEGVIVGWRNTIPDWNPEWDYRVKPKEWYEDSDVIGKPVWVRDRETDIWQVDKFLYYTHDSEIPRFNCSIHNWKYAKPVKPEDTFGYKK